MWYQDIPEQAVVAEFIKLNKTKVQNIKPEDLTKTYYQHIDDGHDKFWMVTTMQRGEKWLLIRKWGKIGTKGQTQEDEFSTEKAIFEKRIALAGDKLLKGYKALW